jgi:hypothetical protein
LASGEPRLGLPALAGLFSSNQCQDLDRARLENHSLLTAMYRLAWLKQTAGVARVNWRDMGPEELGSVYESLLELQPQITQEGRLFTFAQTGEAKGNARKTTGSYYTPDSLVQLLLDKALEPVIADAIAKNPGKPVEGLLDLCIVDPACGSGHFLLAAARRLAVHVARRKAEGTPSASDYRRALRHVIGKCIFGVDQNPMAVELCKVSLWMEAVEPGLPLTFLNSHIQQGNALLGATPSLLDGSIPDAAWEPIEGDDRKVASALKKRNKSEAAGHRALPFNESDPTTREARAVARAVAALEAAGDDNATAVSTKEAGWSAILESPEYRHQKFVADTWCAAFVWPKKSGDVADAAPTFDRWRQIRDGASNPPAHTIATVLAITDRYGFFHWHLQFPLVFERGGFDVVLGNPPWERVKLQEQEFFASRSESIANAVNAAARKKLIARLPHEDPLLWDEWTAASRKAEGESHFIRQSGRYPLCGKGDVNTYAVFAEHNRQALRASGLAGFIVPPGLATDDTTKAYFQDLVAQNALVSLYEFENEEFLFPGIDHRVRFIVITAAKARSTSSPAADLAFGNRSVSALADRSRHFTLTPADFEALNPNTKTCPTFRSSRDADINLAMYRRAGILWREGDEHGGNPWQIRFMAMFHMSNDSGLFNARATLAGDGFELAGNRFVKGSSEFVPLIEAKMVRHFDHRFGTYDGQSESQENQGKLPELDDIAHADPQRCTLPYYWVAQSEVADRLSGRWQRGWLLGWRDICRSTDQRTVLASLIPCTAVGDKFLLMLPAIEPGLAACLYGSLCSFPLDYAARQKLGGTSLKYFTMRQLPVLAPSVYGCDTPWQRGTPLRDFILPRVLELTYTAWDLQSFAVDIGYDGPPFRWSPDRRFLLRCELDAAFFFAYGLSRDDTAYVMDTFPIVRKIEEKAYGAYRSKDTILEIYDAMDEAVRTSGVYQTRLDPVSADIRLAHPPRLTSEKIAEMPSIVPSLAPAHEGAILIWAILHASGGTIRRSDLARAFALRNRPELLTRLAPAAVATKATQWAKARGTGIATGTLAGILHDLAGRSGVDIATDVEGRSIVRLNSNAPPIDRLEDWYRFEASLVVYVLKSLPTTNVAAIDAAVTGDDRALLVS